MKAPALFLASAMVLASGAANAATFTVNGTANPFLAGAASGQTIALNGFTDTAPADSPVAVAVTAGQTLGITATGSVGNCGGCSSPNPNGGGATASSAITGGTYSTFVNGYASLPINSLVGVFNGINGGNVFFIGASDLSIPVPVGATELYLGTVDGYQWSNNEGSFSVDVAGANGVPEPATWAMMLVGMGMVGYALRNRAKVNTTVRYA